MNSRYDIISERTGRVILSTLFDAPPDGVKGKQVRTLVSILSKTKKALEDVFGRGQVRVSLDSYEGSVFWYLILFRPYFFSSRHPLFGDKKYSIYEIIQKGGAAELQKTDLGLVYDKENNWLILLWDEAKELLKSIEDCPSWARILKEYGKRSGEKAQVEWWRRCAESFSWILPHWSLYKMRYMKEKLWFRPEAGYANVSVLNLAGIELLKLEGEGKGLGEEVHLQVARRIRYAHHYTTSDKREFKSARALEKKLKKQEEKKQSKKNEEAIRQRLRRKGLGTKGKHRKWFLASRIVQALPKEIGKSIMHKYRHHLSGRDCMKRFDVVLDAYINGEFELGRVNWTRVHALLGELGPLLESDEVPVEFGEWLVWREGGKYLDAYVERRSR